MKKINFFLSFIFTFLTAFYVNAQDVIVKKDASTTLAKILEINDSDIKFKKFSNLDGPTYSVKISEVNYIKYENGEEEVFGKRSTVSYNGEQTVSDANLFKMTSPYTAKGKRLRRTAIIGGCAILGASLAATIACSWDFQAGDFYPEYFGILGAGVVLGGAWYFCFNSQAKKNREYVYIAPIYEQDILSIGDKSLTASVDVINDNSKLRNNTLGVGLHFNF